MKKVVYFLFAAFVLVACEPENIGNRVRIGVSLDEKAQPNKGQQRISAIDGTTDIEINWEKDDKLYYTLSNESPNSNTPFEIISGWDTKSAFFECANFDSELLNKSLNWYYNGANEFMINPFVKSQSITIKDGKTNINNDYLLYTANNQKIGTIQLKPAFKLLGIALTGDSEIQKTIHAVVGPTDEHGKGESGNWTDIYSCNLVDDKGILQMVQLDITTPITFYIVLPYDYDFTGKSVWLSYARKHNISTNIALDEIQQLSEEKLGEALILNINVTDNPGTGSWDGLKLNKPNQQ